MRPFLKLKLLLLVALAGLLLSTAKADDFGTPEKVWTWVMEVKQIPGTRKIMTSFGLEPNEHQICACRVVGPRVECGCDKPRLGVCLETGS